MKQPKAVAEAIARLQSKKEEFEAAKATLKILEEEMRDADDDVRKAQTEADSAYPQCDLVTVRRFGGKACDPVRVAIIRKTPGGLLVVRRVGVPDGLQYKFKWAEYSSVFRQSEKTGSYSDCRELRAVPAEYLPNNTDPQP
jgi:hypothetical protein